MTLFQRIKLMFSAGEQGVWYDPSDFSTMWQDSAGTTPVTAVEQPVGLVLDKSKGLVLGAELVSNGSEFADSAGWTAAGGVISVAAGTLSITSSGSGFAARAQYQAVTTVSGRTYRVLASNIAGSMVVRVGTTAGGTDLLVSSTQAAGTNYSAVFTATSTTSYFSAVGSSVNGIVLTIDNISVKELPGNHGKQATSAARPLEKGSPYRIDYDGVDDSIGITFPVSLGAACTVARAVPGVGASILTAQTIGTSYTDNADHCGLIIVNRALTASETASVTAYLNAKAGV